MTSPLTITLIIEDSEGMRLDRYLRKSYPTLTQAVIEKSLRQGKIRLDGMKTASNVRVQLGQELTFPSHFEIPHESAKPTREKFVPPFTKNDEIFVESMIVWEDEDILVINKPQGLSTQGGSKTTRHLDGLLTGYGKKHNKKFRLVHRLDRDTSGVLLVAKTRDMATYLTNTFRDGLVKKVYWAVVVGQPKPGQGVINAPLLKGSESSEGSVEKVTVDSAGKPAITHYRTVKGLQKRGITQFAWLELFPETGRTHQLRVHTLHIKHPILGDGKYGGQVATAGSRHLHLHARALTFPDKLTGSSLTFVAPPPPHMIDTLTYYDIDWERSH
jgi:23S rRNA pseudouridine955/2504/2580 synthase